MKLEIVDRRKVLRDFNERNGSTHPDSRYVSVRVVDNDSQNARLVFGHVNSEGRSIFTPDNGKNHLRGLRVGDSCQD